MSEEEARTKWCPMVRIMLGHDNQAWQGISITNRGETFSGPQNCLCISSDCMKWPECKFWWERPTIEQIRADYDEQARKTAKIIAEEFDTKHGGTP